MLYLASPSEIYDSLFYPKESALEKMCLSELFIMLSVMRKRENNNNKIYCLEKFLEKKNVPVLSISQEWFAPHLYIKNYIFSFCKICTLEK